ncbi:MAG TPA: DUF4433 domain-containing protein [Tepidisphaeraceae bacterium]|jgi:hypothetical protein|nr:DUF4433 domain-containing protein [Tepidisphaeraceae bacterium]
MAGLNAEDARIFRITHIDNVPWILGNGLHSRSSPHQDPSFVQIGLLDLIDKRASRRVPAGPGGLLSDYVPFYFTPWSIMMYKIKTGHGGDVIQRANREIVIMVSSVYRLLEKNISFVFTNAHAYMMEADYFTDVRQLSEVDWPLLRSRDFKTDPNDPGKQGRYQAECLVHKHLPIDALLGIACYDENAKAKLADKSRACGSPIKIDTVQGWYF